MEGNEIPSLTGEEVLGLLRSTVKLSAQEAVCINGGYVRFEGDTIVISRRVKKYLYMALRKGGWKVRLDLNLEIPATKTLEALRKAIEIGDRLMVKATKEVSAQNKGEAERRVMEANQTYRLVKETIPKIYLPENRKRELDDIKSLCDSKLIDLKNKAMLMGIKIVEDTGFRELDPDM